MNQEVHTFKYRLEYEESYEAFYMLAFKWDRRVKTVIGSVLTALAVILMILYYMDHQKAYYFYLVILIVAMLFYLIYMPVLAARRGARKVKKSNGIYKLSIRGDGMISSPDLKGYVAVSGDKNARAIETVRSFILRLDGTHTFCIPKRIMDRQEEDSIRKIFADSDIDYHRNIKG